MKNISSIENSKRCNATDRIAIIGVDRDFSTQPRIINEVEVFSGRYLIDGFGKIPGIGLLVFFRLCRPGPLIRKLVYILGGFLPKFRIFFELFYYRNYIEKIKRSDYRFVISHQIDDCLIAMAAGIPFFFHSNEYLPRQFDGSRLFRFVESRYRHMVIQSILSEAILTIVEGDAVAREYASVFGIPEDRFIVMPNMPRYRDSFREKNVEPGPIKLVHHGALVPERGVELLMDVASHLGPGYHLTLMGPGPSDYLESLKRRAEKSGNIEIVSSVPYDEIVETLNGQDLGLIIFGSPHYHTKYMTVPNKFWECLQARVPVLVSSESAMSAYVRESGCGIISGTATLEGYVSAIRSVSRDDIAAMKAVCEEKAWIHSRDSWLRTYRERIDLAVDDIRHVQKIVGKVFFDDITFVATADDEIVDAMR